MTTERVIEAAAADGAAMTLAELRAFLAEIGDEDAGIMASTGHRGYVSRMTAVIPPRSETTGTVLPGDPLRDAAALLEATERGDLAASFILFASLDNGGAWGIAMFLAGECMTLARELYGDDADQWVARLRQGAAAADADLGPQEG
jgi:hypothetical protein